MNGRRLLIGGILLGLLIYLLSNGITEHLDTTTPPPPTPAPTGASGASGPDITLPATDQSCTTEAERLSGTPIKLNKSGICASIPAGGKLQWLRDFLCSTTPGCKEGQIMEAGLCYDACKPGYKSDGALICYKQYRGFDCDPGSHGGNTIFSLLKDSRVVAPTGVGEQCGPNEERSGALCYPKCAAGYHRIAATCWAKDIGPGKAMHFRG